MIPSQPLPASAHRCIAYVRLYSVKRGFEYWPCIVTSFACGQWQPAYFQLGGISGAGGGGGISGGVGGDMGGGSSSHSEQPQQ